MCFFLFMCVLVCVSEYLVGFSVAVEGVLLSVCGYLSVSNKVVRV